ncbi:nuclear transport factor 2 family protein [Mycobacterium bourgelatii]|uniref:SnoaL-like domain-containing protein n=1 Tax=Mycobacterium bourgelatii TaxID=1273442 RepID=A0A7I9YYR8_MYCBU|nr:nuclear transport factor 2 family protein [Mycobacterium bourgelatii]MCV6976320.1 nuclear transport factor 2 family protein [Mycobacterium bourgelatii]GFG93758.1 hypothetical protein MBOU_58000 [Mycobacterium bourgelatii]
MTPSDSLLTEMLDEYQLRRLVHAYCRAVDRGDTVQLRSLYHPDAADNHGRFSAGGTDDFFANLDAARPYLRAMQHNITTANFVISGHLAEGEVYSIAMHTFRARGRDVDVLIGGRYLDKYEKRDGTWGFTERMIVTDWARVSDPSVLDFSHPIVEGTPRGAMDANDPSYQFFSLFPGHPVAD